MHIIEVAPLRPGIALPVLTYFSTERYERGTILSIPIRSKIERGVVIDVTPASGAKTALRRATFSLKKLPEQIHTDALPAPLIRVADSLAMHYASTMGSVLFSLLPNELKKGTLPIVAHESHSISRTFEYKVFADIKAHRFHEYQSLIREQFANMRSVHIVAPSAVDIDILVTTLGAGIEQHTVILESGLPKKKLLAAWSALSDLSHPKLLITTPQYGFVDRDDIHVVILERARGSGYRSQRRPYIDYRVAYKAHAKEYARMLIVGDTVLRSEEIEDLRSTVAEPYGELPKRILLPGRPEVVLMVHKPDGSVPFTLFSSTLLKELKTTLEKKGHVFLFAARRGLAPLVACVDCGYILRSPESGAPLSLHRTIRDGIEERWLVCSVSGYRERARDLCPSCGSWRLKERGIGIQQVYDSLSTHIDPEGITLFDHTTARTHKKATELITSFYKKKGSVLLGTTLALPYIERPVNLSAVTSMDALRSIPSWKQHEEIFSVLMHLREKTNGKVIIQTRTTDSEIISLVEKGRLTDFYDEELMTREQYNYPPYAVFIHLTWIGDSTAVKKMNEHIKQTFKEYNVTTYTTLRPESGKVQAGAQTRQALIRVPRAQWPHEEIVKKLRALPPNVRIIIDPDRIL